VALRDPVVLVADFGWGVSAPAVPAPSRSCGFRCSLITCGPSALRRPADAGPAHRWRSTAWGGGHQACRPSVGARSLTLSRASLRSRPRAAAARAPRLFEISGPARRWRFAPRIACISHQPAALLVPVVVRPSHASWPGGAHGQGPASLSSAPVRCSPSAALRVRPVGSPLTSRLFPRAWCAVRRTTQGNDGTHAPLPR